MYIDNKELQAVAGLLGGCGLGVRTARVTAPNLKSGREKGESGKMDEEEKVSLCSRESVLLFLICSGFKVQKSGFIPSRSPSAALSHISFVGLQTNRQQCQG